MFVMITGFESPDETIRCVKGLRAASGSGLRDAKHIFDNVKSGNQQVLELMGDQETSLGILEDSGIHYTMPNGQNVADYNRAVLISALRKMPGHLAIFEVLQILEAVS